MILDTNLEKNSEIKSKFFDMFSDTKLWFYPQQIHKFLSFFLHIVTAFDLFT